LDLLEDLLGNGQYQSAGPNSGERYRFEVPYAWIINIVADGVAMSVEETVLNLVELDSVL
jgi:hypothetical protein